MDTVDWKPLYCHFACRRGVGAFKSKVKAVDKKQKYSLRETDKRLKRLARRMTGKYNVIMIKILTK